MLCAAYRDYMQDLHRSTPEASPVACLPAPPQAPLTPPHEPPLTPPPQTPSIPPPQCSPQASLPPLHQYLLPSHHPYHLFRPYSVPEPQPNPAPTSHSAPEEQLNTSLIVVGYNCFYMEVICSAHFLQAAEYTIFLEAWQVPALYNYCTIKRICSIPLKLNVLWQAFADQTLFQQAYDQLLAFTQNLSLCGVISAELVQIGINCFNIIDVVSEVVVLGVLGGARPPIFPSPVGFLGHLMAMLFTFTPTSKFRNPRAEHCFFLLQT
ncbi:hypothetical protein MHYP_G00056350 [Metynnis hypsauchen]